jgi:hypothetical protein
MSAYNNLSIVRNVAFSHLKKELTVDFKLAFNSLYLHNNKRVLLFYTDHDGEYKAIDPELVDIEINCDLLGYFTLTAKKSEASIFNPMRRMRAGYEWLFHHKQVDVAVYQEFGFVEATNRGLATDRLELDIGSIPNTYVVIDEEGDPSTVYPTTESNLIDRFRMYEGDKIDIKKTGTVYEGVDSLYKGNKTEGVDSLYKEYKTESVDSLYKEYKTESVSKEYVATITTKLDPKRCTELVDLLRANGFLDVTIKI